MSGEQPDARHVVKASRFRPAYRELTVNERVLVSAIKAKADELGALYEQIGGGRHQVLALNELEASVMWAVKEITT